MFVVGAAVIPTYQVFLDEEAEAPRNRMVCLRSTHCLGCGELRRSQGARCAWTSSPHTTRGSLGGQLPAPAPPDPLEVIMGTASAQKLGVEQLSRHFPMQGPLLKSSRFRAGFQGVGGEPQILRHLQTLLCSLIPGITGKSIHGPHSGKPPRHTPAFMSLLHQPSAPSYG